METMPPSLVVQTLLYRTHKAALFRTLEAIDHSAEIGKSGGLGSYVGLVIGDGSPAPVLTDADIARIGAEFAHIDAVTYHFFDANVGTAAGHNHLATLSRDNDYILISNPDVVPEARAIWHMTAVLEDESVGFVEAKQLPLEHPKEYEIGSGETSWASTAFALTRRDLFERLGGFDAQSFFMYGDDLDYSWRVREAGYKVVFQPAAVAFHGKTLSPAGEWLPTAAEVRYSAEAALFLTHKWSREDLTDRILADLEATANPDVLAATAKFRERRERGELVPQRDREHRVGTFVGGNYAKHRFW